MEGAIGAGGVDVKVLIVVAHGWRLELSTLEKSSNE